jgi:hypothetical protein
MAGGDSAMTSKTKFTGSVPFGLEPRLSEVLSDPLVHAVMARDGVTLDELRSVIHHAQSNLRQR